MNSFELVQKSQSFLNLHGIWRWSKESGVISRSLVILRTTGEIKTCIIEKRGTAGLQSYRKNVFCIC